MFAFVSLSLVLLSHNSLSPILLHSLSPPLPPSQSLSPHLREEALLDPQNRLSILLCQRDCQPPQRLLHSLGIQVSAGSVSVEKVLWEERRMSIGVTSLHFCMTSFSYFLLPSLPRSSSSSFPSVI